MITEYLTDMLSPCTPPFVINFASNQSIEETIIHLLSWMLKIVGQIICDHISTKGGTDGFGKRHDEEEEV
jgi:hypothetical protein